MFETHNFPESLDEEIFEKWLIIGKQSKIGYGYLLIIWDEMDASFKPVYAEDRDKINQFIPTGGEIFVAAYDLYSENRIK